MESGFTCEYDWNHEQYDTKKQAIKEGFEIRESDDFNIGEVEGDRLVAMWWMDEKMDHSKRALNNIARDIGL